MKPTRLLFSHPYSHLVLISVLAIGSASAQLTWDPNGNVDSAASDGAGTWLNPGFWWDGAANVDWSNTTNANTIAIFGTGTTTGLAGQISLAGNVNAGGLRFDSIKLPTAASAGPPPVL